MASIVTDYLDSAAKYNPNKIAYVDSNRELTFKHLQDNSYRIASFLLNKKISKSPIAIYFNKNVDTIEALMGVAYSGNFYTIIDKKMPIDRVKKILNTLSPKLIITDDSSNDSIATLLDGYEITTYKEMMNAKIDLPQIMQTKKKICDSDVLYVLFTSGSTGIPKGVVIPHKGVITYTEWCANEFKFDERTIFGNQTPFYFSMSVLDIFQTLRNSATMYIIPHNLFSFPIKLLAYMEERKINTIYWVPSALCLVANLKALNKVVVSTLEKVLFAGEVMPTKQLNAWLKTYPDVLFANLYGPTEVTDICTFYKVKNIIPDTESIPIGVPCKDSGIILLDENNGEAKKGDIGELCVYGSTLAYGYYGNPQKTNEVFIQNPLNNKFNQVIYRTGDLVYYNEKDELIYKGRKDFQIKHMGHRIELGEIETIISSLEDITRCCCLYDINESKIVLFYTGTASMNDIDTCVNNMLPIYMHPAKVIKLDDMPINLNGKIDRNLLKTLL